MINGTILRAVSRLSPRMAAYQVRRFARNRLAHSFPAAYARHIARVTRGLPELAGPTEATLAIARTVAQFYHDEYLPQIDDALDGTFTFFGQTVRFGSPGAIDWHHQVAAETDFHLWRMKLGHMGFLCPMLISGGTAHLDAVGQIIQNYRTTTPFSQAGCFSSYWFPYSVSHRILALLSGYVIARANGQVPPALAKEIAEFLRSNAGFVLANVEHELKNNHVERNLAALCLYLTCAGGAPEKLVRRLDRDVRRIVADTVLPDGMLSERSAMYQGLTVMALHVFAATPFLSPQTKALVAERLTAARRAWALMTHPDGEIALFNDSWMGEVPPPGPILGQVDFAPLELLADAGYARLEKGGVFALFDAGAIGPRWNPGHGHADFLSAEVDVAGRRFLVDPGTYQYSTGPRRFFERASDSHNGPTWPGVEPVGYSGCFKVGAMATAALVDAQGDGTGAWVTGELRLKQGRLSRSVTVSQDRLSFEDRWQGRPGPGRVRLIVQGEWHLDQRSTARLVFTCNGDRAEIVLGTGQIGAIAQGVWSRHYLSSEGATHIILQSADREGQHDLAWSVCNLGRVKVGAEASTRMDADTSNMDRFPSTGPVPFETVSDRE